MNKLFLRLLLIPALLCAVLGVGFLSTTGLAHAATLQASVQAITAQPAYNPGKNCTFGNAEMDQVEDPSTATYTVYCFPSDVGYAGSETDIYILNTGLHTVTWDWIDCNGNEHHSSKPERTIVMSSNSPGGFAGCSYMAKVFDVVLTQP